MQDRLKMIINFGQPESNSTTHYVVLAPSNSVFVHCAPCIVSSQRKGKFASLKKHRWWNIVWKHLEHINREELECLDEFQRKTGAHSLRSGVLKGHVYLAGWGSLLVWRWANVLQQSWWCFLAKLPAFSTPPPYFLSQTTHRVRRVST